MSQGREDLARTALERKQFAQGELQSLDQQVAELESQQASLIEKGQAALQDRSVPRKEVIKAQYSAAEASVKISEAASGVGEEMADMGMAMQRALDKAEDMRARADAMDELEAAGAFDDNLQLGRAQDDIDRELHQLTSLRGGGRRPRAPPGRARLGLAPSRHRCGRLGDPPAPEPAPQP